MTKEEQERQKRINNYIKWYNYIYREAEKQDDSLGWLRRKVMRVHTDMVIDLDSSELRDELLNCIEYGARGVEKMTKVELIDELIDTYIDSSPREFRDFKEWFTTKEEDDD